MNTNNLRLFSAGWSFIDNNGKPLLGEVSFYDKDDTTQPCVVYDSEGTVIANPIQTTDTGRTVQPVYLENDKIYTVFFYKYTEGNKELQYSVEIPKNTFVFDFGSDTQTQLVYFPNVATMTSSHYPWREDNIYGLLGYYESGDTDVVYYKAKKRKNGDPNPNGGSVLVGYDTDGNAYTLSLNSFYSVKYFDVRHFGIVPSMYNDVNNSSLALCDSYCHDNGYIMSFTKNGNDSVYTFINLQYTFLSTIYATSDITLLFTNSNVPRLELADCHPVIAADSDTSEKVMVYADELWLSTKGSEHVILNPRIVYYIDAEWSQQEITAKNCNVVIQGEYSNTYNLDNCDIISNRCIKSDLEHTFHNCILDSEMFTNITNYWDFASTQHLYNNNYIGAWNATAQLFLKVVDDAYTTIDLQGKDVTIPESGFTFNYSTTAPKTLKNGGIVRGLYLRVPSNSIDKGNNVTFENIAHLQDLFTLATVNVDNYLNISFTNCVIENETHVLTQTCQMKNCYFTGQGAIKCIGKGVFENSEIGSKTNENYGIVYTGYDSEITNCTVYSHIELFASDINKNDAINEGWQVNDAMPTYSCKIVGNLFECDNSQEKGYVNFHNMFVNGAMLPEYGTYVSGKCTIANNVVKNLPGSGNTQSYPPDTDINYERFVRFDATRIFQWTGAYVYANNVGDGYGGHKLLYLPAVKSTDAVTTVGPCIIPDSSNNKTFTLRFFVSHLFFNFGEVNSKRIWNIYYKISSVYGNNFCKINALSEAEYDKTSPNADECLELTYTRTMVTPVNRDAYLFPGANINEPEILTGTKEIEVGDTLFFEVEAVDMSNSTFNTKPN